MGDTLSKEKILNWIYNGNAAGFTIGEFISLINLGYFNANDERLKFASEDQKKGGWTLAPELLDELQNKIGMFEDAPSWEGIELVLLAHYDLPLPLPDEEDDNG